MLPGLQEPDLSGGGPPNPGEESFWSSFSVVESLFSDDGSPYRGGDQGGSRLPFMRQLKSQEEAFPPLPPSSSPYDDNGGSSHSQQHHHHGSSHRRGGHSQRRGGGGSGEWITPHTNNHNGGAAPTPVGHHLFPPMQGSSNGQNYYNAFNGYNQHFVGSPTSSMNEGYGDGRFSNGSPTFSIFSDFHSRQQQQQQQQLNVALGGLSLGQNAFTAVPDIGVSVERHQQGYAPRVDLSSSPSAGYPSPSLARKRSTAQSTTTTTIIAPPMGVSTGGYNVASNNKICCDDKALLEEDLPVKGLPFSLLLALPNDHLLKILSYLSGRDLSNLQMVGKKRLAILSTDNSLWKDLYMRRWTPSPSGQSAPQQQHSGGGKKGSAPNSPAGGRDEDSGDEWAWIQSLLQQNERWKDIFQSRHSAERWRIGTLKMFNGCWGFISQHAPDSSAPLPNGETLDIFFHRKDIAPEGDWYEDWWLKDTPGVSRSQKCGYWDTFLCGRVVRYKQRAAYAQGRRPQACNISFVGDERRTDRMPTTLAYGVGGTLVTPEGMVLPPSMRFASIPTTGGNTNPN